jgi:hypothetical protein
VTELSAGKKTQRRKVVAIHRWFTSKISVLYACAATRDTKAALRDTTRGL